MRKHSDEFRAVYQFGLGDVEDPDLYARLHIGEWFNTSERGTWLHKNNTGIVYDIDHDGSMDGGWLCTVRCRITPGPQTSYYCIRWPEVETRHG